MKHASVRAVRQKHLVGRRWGRRPNSVSPLSTRVSRASSAKKGTMAARMPVPKCAQRLVEQAHVGARLPACDPGPEVFCGWAPRPLQFGGAALMVAQRRP